LKKRFQTIDGSGNSLKGKSTEAFIGCVIFQLHGIDINCGIQQWQWAKDDKSKQNDYADNKAMITSPASAHSKKLDNAVIFQTI